jgi:hypothetical protein
MKARHTEERKKKEKEKEEGKKVSGNYTLSLPEG